MEMIKVTSVCKEYGGANEINVSALKDINLSIESGTFVCVVGASGSGKSTLLHVLAGVDQVTSGSIVVNGKEITKLSEEDLASYRRSDIGIVYQFFNLIPVLSAKENILMPLNMVGKSVDQDYFNKIISMLSIEDRIDFYPNKLSGGEQQRVAIARALIHKPSLILADEPTGNLNSQLSDEIIQFFVKACRELNQTIVMITHDLNLARYADRVLEIKDGCIVSDIYNQK